MSGPVVSLADIAELGAAHARDRRRGDRRGRRARPAHDRDRHHGRLGGDRRRPLRLPRAGEAPVPPARAGRRDPVRGEPLLAHPRWASRRTPFPTRARCPRSGTTGCGCKRGARRRLGHPRLLHARRACCPTARATGRSACTTASRASSAADEQALLEVLARMLGLELWRERAAARAASTRSRRSRSAERKRVELADELQHELRAPLQVIDGYAEGMLDGVVVARRRAHDARAPRGRPRDPAAGRPRRARPPRGRRRARRRGAGARSTRSRAEMRDRLAPLAESAGIELVADVSAGRGRDPGASASSSSS